ncbi:MaoC/PaaZ C-terminal domain-containing protein [Glutamicibacter endophyticus]
MEAQLVTEIPGLGGVYARALRTIGRKPNAAVLPQTTLVYPGATVDRAALDAYCQATGAPNNDILPSLFVHTQVFPLAMSLMARDDFPLPLLGMIHLSSQISVDEPLDAAESFDVQVRAENLAAHRKGTSCELVVEILVGSSTRMEMRHVFLAKGVSLPGVAAPKVSEAPESAADTPRRTAHWKLDAGTGRRWAKVSGDFNPIHLSGLSAKALGMPRAIAHGIYLGARALAGIEPQAGSYRWHIDFKTPVLLPGSVDLAFEPQANGYRVSAWNPRRGKPHFELVLERES